MRGEINLRARRIHGVGTNGITGVTDGHVAPNMQGKMERDDEDSMHKSIAELDPQSEHAHHVGLIDTPTKADLNLHFGIHLDL